VTPLPGQGAFYGPKIGFDFRDVLERTWTLATVQIDCAMPERFGLRYVTPEGTEATPVMIHRAVLGTLERFIRDPPRAQPRGSCRSGSRRCR
jgi:threonyl-tRNA synthetase